MLWPVWRNLILCKMISTAFKHVAITACNLAAYILITTYSNEAQYQIFIEQSDSVLDEYKQFNIQYILAKRPLLRLLVKIIVYGSIYCNKLR